MRSEYPESWPAMSNAEIHTFVTNNSLKFGNSHNYDSDKLANELIVTHKRHHASEAYNADDAIKELSNEFQHELFDHYQHKVNIAARSEHFVAKPEDVDEINW